MALIRSRAPCTVLKDAIPRQPCFSVRRHQRGLTHIRPARSILRPSEIVEMSKHGKEGNFEMEAVSFEHRDVENLIQSRPSTSYEQDNAVDEVSEGRGEGQIKQWWKIMLKTAAAGALCLALVVAAASPALAARSGGRVGGSAFNSGGRSFSGPSITRSYGGAGAGLGGSMFGGSVSSPSLRGYSRSSVQGSAFGFFGPPAPWGYGGYGGYGGVPVASSGGFGLGGILLFGILAAVLFSIFSSSDGDFGGGDVDEAVTVVKLQVGLLGTARQLKRDLNKITGRADTTSPDGLHYILQETVLALLRNPDYAVYGAATTSKQRGLEKGEAKFNRTSMEERGKIKEETMVNYDGRSRRGSFSGSSSGKGPGNEMIVVTIIAAIDRRVDLPKVTTGEELREALNILGSVGTEEVLACEVLWVPEDENDHYTKDDIFQDYPTLNNL